MSLPAQGIGDDPGPDCEWSRGSISSARYSVNANGNLTARGADTFGYDQANRLKTASVSGVSSSYSYDGDGRRASKTVGGAGTSYTYDVNASLPVLLDDGTRKYVWGLGLAYAVDSSGSPLVYHSDGLGSVRALTDSAGSIVQTYLYDEYGVVTSTQGSISQPFQYTGEQRDGETGFMYLRARMYDPGMGRFMGRDPLLGMIGSPLTLNRYSYIENDPVNATDPSGLSRWEGSYENDCIKKLFKEGGYVLDARCMQYDILKENQVQGKSQSEGWAWMPTGSVLGPTVLFAKREKGMLDQIARERGLSQDERRELGRAVEEWKRKILGLGNADKITKRVIEEIADAEGLGSPPR